MGGNIPGGNFLGGNFPGWGNFPGGNLMGGDFSGGTFPESEFSYNPLQHRFFKEHPSWFNKHQKVSEGKWRCMDSIKHKT